MKQELRRDTVPPLKKYREYKLLPQPLGWVVLLAWSASLIAWALWLHAIIPDVERQWDFGQAAFTPAESIYSTVSVPADMPAIRQIEPLPEADPLKAFKGKSP